MNPISMRRVSLPAALLFLLWLFLWMPASASLAQEADGLTPLQVAEIQPVSSAAISPDGNHVAYTLMVQADPQEENESASSHLYVLDVESGETSELYSETSVSSIAFRPEHGTVTFMTAIEDNGDEGNVLYEIPAEGGEPTRLVNFETSLLGYEWNPDGERVAFMANEPTETTEPALPYEPEVFEEGLPQRRAYVHDLSGEEGESQEFNVEGSIYLMAWSPDGERLAVSAAPTPHIDDFYMFQEVSVLDAASRDVVAEIDNEGKIGQITWSPDGSQLALRAGDDVHDPIDGRIMRVSAEGGTPENIAPDFEGTFEQIAWTGDDTIHFIASESADRSFGTIHPDGADVTRLVDVGGPALLSFARTDDGQVAFRASTPEHPAEVFLMNAEGQAPERVTNSNPWLEDVPLGRQEIVQHSTRDGAFELEGLLIYPIDYEEGTPVPTIVVVHGGPEAHYSNEWLTGYNLPGQMGAARGYAVFYPNYRGSTGRGLEFAKSSQADLAGREFDDIVDGVDHLIEEGIADGDRIGVTGGSYGGYATAWMSTYYSDRFAAGVMNVGISNNLSKWGTSDIPEELFLVHARERIWDHWQDYLERSPIYHVDNAETPILIAHGAEDTRVHPGQSLELYRHLKVRRPDVPVRLVLYPGEGHGYARSSARLDYNLRLLEWFDTYLMGDEEMPDRELELPEAPEGTEVAPETR